METFELYLLFKIIFLISIYLLLISYWNKSNNFFLKKYNSVQRIHVGETPRIGGALSYLAIFFFSIIYMKQHDNLILTLLISYIPILLTSLKDDIFQNSSPKFRLISMILSICLFFNVFSFDFPELNIFSIQNLLFHNNFFVQIFFLFSCLVMINGNNLIDGSNGLMAITNLCQLVALLFLFYSYGDLNIVRSIICFIIPLVVFLIFNYPFGKVFMGDSGAYLYGFLISLLVIIFFGKYPNANPLAAVLILFYPCYELLFTFIRKIRNKVNPFKPDSSHLHTIIYKTHKYNNNLTRNNFVLPKLFPFWFLPPILTTIFIQNQNGLFLSIFLLIVLYNGFYILFKSKNKLIF